jgi:3'(2'), 5'-bisphosphate nucleotidase
MIEIAIEAAREAGTLVMSHYRRGVETALKEDLSPVTEADMAASACIRHRLNDTGLPVLCEERVIEFAERQSWDRFWLVDPLDGTREFLNANDQFTVNIALIENGRPILGVVHAPALNLLAWAVEGRGAFLESDQGQTKLAARSNERVGMQSNSHPSSRVDQFYSDNGVSKTESLGAALKFIRIAQGAASLYARFTGSKEWDTAAGQIILLESGGWMVEPKSRKPLAYNKADLRNQDFVIGCADWDPATLKWPEER